MNIIETLNKSIVYNMSLGSKELFHSNLWAWLIENDHSFSKVFFEDIELDVIKEIRREDKNRDIVIHLNNNNCYIIENKIKSLPTNEQLNGYSESKHFHKGILTGLIETLDIKAKDKWSFISYKDIATNIRKIAEKSNADNIKKYEKIIFEYCEVIELLDGIINNQLKEEENILSYNVGELTQIRFDDVYKKLKAAHFAAYLKNKINIDEFISEWGKVEIQTSFSDKNAIIDIKYIKNRDKDTKKIEASLGIQLQGRQFRIIAEGKPNEGCDEIFRNYLKYDWFDKEFDVRAKEKKVFNRITSMTPMNQKQYNKYGETFVYQFFNIENKNYDDLCENIMQYIKKAKQIIEKITYKKGEKDG